MTSKTNIRKFPAMEAGQVYGRLTAVAFVRMAKKGAAIWTFMCQCGNEHETRADSVRRSLSRSCGCLHRERASATATHRMSFSSEYAIWRGMIARCTNSSNKRFSDYGGRGIKVCERWRESFEAFYADIGARPSKDHSIERINNAGNYDPGNVRWATQKEQHRNMRSNRIVVVDGTAMPLIEAAERVGLPYSMVKGRLNRGWSAAAAFGTPSSRASGK